MLLTPITLDGHYVTCLVVVPRYSFGLFRFVSHCFLFDLLGFCSSPKIAGSRLLGVSALHHVHGHVFVRVVQPWTW